MKQLDRRKNISLNSSESPDMRHSTNPLFGSSRGKMFGIMECLTSDGSTLLFKAFSGQFNGLWLVEGWVPPLFEVDEWTHVNSGPESKIKTLTQQIQTCSDEKKKPLQQERKSLSQKLMKDLHALYRITNFRSQTLSLPDIFPGRTGIPTGTGDCCAPKLLNFAATKNLIPIGISEFYWGRENKSANRQHGLFYPPCVEKCRPILNFILCGLNELYERQKL